MTMITTMITAFGLDEEAFTWEGKPLPSRIHVAKVSRKSPLGRHGGSNDFWWDPRDTPEQHHIYNIDNHIHNNFKNSIPGVSRPW